ncbi:hypothetical protein NBZ79_00615 [Sneathiella marina]|uniref:Uncharacterized protein n=1 Tax=Sneathiella marina TaxID=2950108 RepID=A0ABY4W3E2_9PROT|nr:hypothetical protein [Sneathiella marina]USG61477.1 hypothetical protein NBZ79_00615 [Sneathiella marina]
MSEGVIDLANTRKIRAATSGNLSAMEVVKLRLGSWAQELRQEQPAFTEKELDAIQDKNLSGQPHKAETFNKWVGLSQEFHAEIYNALSLSLDARATINRIQLAMNLGELAYLNKADQLYQPLVMTEKAAAQYRIDSVEHQKQRRLEGWYSIQDVFVRRAHEILPEKEKARIETDEYGDLLWWDYIDAFPEDASKYGEKALDSIREHIASGDLVFEAEHPTDVMREQWPEIGETAVNVMPEWLDLKTLMGEETSEALQDLHCEYVICGCQGKHLYSLKSQLPEWQALMEKYVQAEMHADLPYCRPVAIIQEPFDGGHLDDNGHFQSFGADAAIRLNAFEKAVERIGPSLFDGMNTNASHKAQAFMVKLATLDAISEYLEIDFFSHLTREWQADLRDATKTFNRSMEHLYYAHSTMAEGDDRRHYINRGKPEPIVLEALRPSQEELEQIRKSLEKEELDGWFKNSFELIFLEGAA